MNFVPFGSTCKLQNGRAFKPTEWSDQGTPIIRIQNLNDPTKPFNYCDFEVDSKFHVHKGDLLFSWSGTPGTSFGAFFWDREKGFLNQHIFKVDVDDSYVDKNYLRYAINSKLNLIIDQAHGGVGLKHITKGKLEAVEIPLPPLAEQKRIAAILDKADAIRRKRQQAIQLADEFLRSVFLDMFGDPVTNPKGWEVCSMRELIHIQGGFAFKSTDFIESGIPIVKIGNANKKGFTVKEIDFIKPDNPKKLEQYELYPGDLLMSLTGTVGKDDYANITEVSNEYEKYYLNQRVAKITVDLERVTKPYLKFYLAHPRIKAEITKNNRGVRQANISNSDIYGLDVPLPDKNTLMLFDQIASKSKEMSEGMSRGPLLSDELLNSLSKTAFSGQL